MTTPLKIVGHIAPKQAEKAEKGIGGRIGLHPCGTGGKRYTVELTRLSSALAALAQRDAEIARLREYYEASEEINQVGILGATPEMFDRENIARKALKDPEA
ncbi:hypothetical protein [Acetobacter oryzifermentans]|uniref:Uncharacterized protein n=1 Tax=Acetobacter oryzifermentans TaxID=1633874 RepID=A0ABN4NLT7_9PROT|nr:hypothetical protein [Acetobacter oryzifermentans]ANA12891.1 hypothetical protein WG31_01710 [Acetobacter oryzifermentans]